MTPQDLARLSGLHTHVADALPRPLRLVCDRCAREERPTPALVAHYLRHGWPRCCGETMKLERRPENGT